MELRVTRRAAAEAFAKAGPSDGFALRGDDKLAFVSGLFDAIAPTYDVLNLLISLGQTTLWRWCAMCLWSVEWLPSRAKVLDVGCGTGASSRLLFYRYKRRKVSVHGVDCSAEMIDRARDWEKGPSSKGKLDDSLSYAQEDVCTLSHGNDTFDVVTTIYTLRNFPDLEVALREMVRVTKKGGRLVILDAFPPDTSTVTGWIMAGALNLWLHGIVPRIAAFFTTPKAYKYLAASIQGTVPARRVREMLEDIGCDVTVTEYSMGAAARVVAFKA